jgi:hypothetical protein
MATRAWRIYCRTLRRLPAMIAAKLAIALAEHALTTRMSAVVTDFGHGTSPGRYGSSTMAQA